MGGLAQLPFRDVVLLVPGFLGLGRLGRFHYFSERISASLRAGLEARVGRPVLVLPCYTRPIGALDCRQRYLIEQLEAVQRAVPTVERFHLVGHSTGGVDAQLLACDRPLEGGSWPEVRRLLASVVGISAPYHGTHLVQAPAVRLLAGELSGKGVTGFANLLLRLMLLLGDQPAVGEILAGAHNQAPEAVAFLYQIFRHRELLDDLDPVHMAVRRARCRPDRRIPLTSFVSVAGLGRGTPCSPDGFFRALHTLTGDSAVATPLVQAALARLAPACPFALDEKASDGVVNAGLQLLDPADPDELGGVVVADHADVIGHYDRGRRPLEERTQRIGLFHSGSGFDDDGFFRLYAGVVDAVCRAIPDAARLPLSRRAG